MLRKMIFTVSSIIDMNREHMEFFFHKQRRAPPFLFCVFSFRKTKNFKSLRPIDKNFFAAIDFKKVYLLEFDADSFKAIPKS